MKLSYKEKNQAWAERRAMFYKMHVEEGLSFNEIGALQKPQITGQTVKILVDKHIKSYEQAKENTTG